MEEALQVGQQLDCDPLRVCVCVCVVLVYLQGWPELYICTVYL
jgi:hypothetical protein